jgi:hypothetical protein
MAGVCGLLAVLGACQAALPPQKDVINQCTIIVEPEGDQSSGSSRSVAALPSFTAKLTAQQQGPSWLKIGPKDASKKICVGGQDISAESKLTVKDWQAACVVAEVGGKEEKVKVAGYGRLSLRHPAFTAFFHESDEAPNAVAMYLYKDKHALRILITP